VGITHFKPLRGCCQVGRGYCLSAGGGCQVAEPSGSTIGQRRFETRAAYPGGNEGI